MKISKKFPSLDDLLQTAFITAFFAGIAFIGVDRYINIIPENKEKGKNITMCCIVEYDHLRRGGNFNPDVYMLKVKSGDHKKYLRFVENGLDHLDEQVNPGTELLISIPEQSFNDRSFELSTEQIIAIDGVSSSYR